MKTLVVYYSRTGNTKIIGQEIAKALNAESLEVIDLKKRSGALGWIKCGRDGQKRNLTKIQPIQKNLEEYGRIIIGTPVWSWNMSAPIRTFLKEKSIINKKVNFFCTEGSSSGKTFQELGSLVPDSVVGEKLEITSKDMKSGLYRDKIMEFAKKIQQDEPQQTNTTA